MASPVVVSLFGCDRIRNDPTLVRISTTLPVKMFSTVKCDYTLCMVRTFRISDARSHSTSIPKHDF